MRSAYRLYGRLLRPMFLLVALPAWGLSVLNWMFEEKIDSFVAALVVALAIGLVFKLRGTATRERLEYALALPIGRTDAIFAPHLLACVLAGGFGLLVWVHECTGAGYLTVRAVAQALGADSWKPWRARGFEPLIHLVTMPALAAAVGSWALERLPRLGETLGPFVEMSVLVLVWGAITFLPDAVRVLAGTGREHELETRLAAGVLYLPLAWLALRGLRASLARRSTESYRSGGEAWES